MDILQEIIKMDKEASERVLAVQSAHTIKQDQAASNAARAGEEAVINERRSLEMFKAQQQALLDEKKANADAILIKQTSKLDAVFAEHKAEWTDEIMKRIIGE